VGTERLQSERVAVFGEFAADVADGQYPAAGHTVVIADEEYRSFLAQLPEGEHR
jgi:hypothetical protein